MMKEDNEDMPKYIFDFFFLLLIISGTIAGLWRFYMLWLVPEKKRDAYIVSNTFVWRVSLFAVAAFLLFFSVAILGFGLVLDGGTSDRVAALLFGVVGIVSLIGAFFYKKIFTFFFGIRYSPESSSAPLEYVPTPSAIQKSLNYGLYFGICLALIFSGLFYFKIIETKTESDRLFFALFYVGAAGMLFAIRYVLFHLVSLLGKLADFAKK